MAEQRRQFVSHFPEHQVLGASCLPFCPDSKTECPQFRDAVSSVPPIELIELAVEPRRCALADPGLHPVSI